MVLLLLYVGGECHCPNNQFSFSRREANLSHELGTRIGACMRLQKNALVCFPFYKMHVTTKMGTKEDHIIFSVSVHVVRAHSSVRKRAKKN